MNLKTGKFEPKRTAPAKNEEGYKEIAEAFKALELGNYVEVSAEDMKPSTLKANIKDYITLEAGQAVRISEVKTLGEDGKSKIVAIKLVKQLATPKKTPAEKAAE